MREGATLKLDSGEEIRVELEREDLDHDEIVLRRSAEPTHSHAERMAVIDKIVASGTPHPAGTTDRLLKADRDRPF